MILTIEKIIIENKGTSVGHKTLPYAIQNFIFADSENYRQPGTKWMKRVYAHIV